MKRILLSAILLGSLVTTASAATGVLSQQNLSLELADKIAQSTLQACVKDGYNVAVTLVDRSGTPLLMKRMDNAGPHTVEARLYFPPQRGICRLGATNPFKAAFPFFRACEEKIG